MQFDFSDDRKDLKASARRFLDKVCRVSTVRSVIDSAAGHDADLWRQVSESGFPAAALPEQYGGGGAAERGSEAHKAVWLLKRASGAAIGTIALAERLGEALPSSIEAEVSPGKFSGVKRPVADASAPDIAIVTDIHFSKRAPSDVDTQIV